MDVLDTPESAGGELDILTRMRTPGALELLSAYERLSPETRSSLLGLMRTLVAEAPVKELA
jgi:hypothetical protein